MIEKNNFTNCNVPNDLIQLVGDYKDVTDNYNVSSLMVYDSRITDNNASYLIRTNFSGTRCSVSINSCIFENNSLRNAVTNIDLIFYDDLLIMEATNPIEIILLNIETNSSKVFELIDGRLIDYYYF